MDNIILLNKHKHLLGRLNMSKILCVTTKPPPMFMDEMKAAKAANVWMVSVGM